MRTIIDLPEEQVKSLDAIGLKTDLSRAELVRLSRILLFPLLPKFLSIDKY